MAAAKKVRQENWASNNVYEQVRNNGQGNISVRWVALSKFVDEKVVCKSRLCAHGFEEL